MKKYERKDASKFVVVFESPALTDDELKSLSLQVDSIYFSDSQTMSIDFIDAVSKDNITAASAILSKLYTPIKKRFSVKVYTFNKKRKRIRCININWSSNNEHKN